MKSQILMHTYVVFGQIAEIRNNLKVAFAATTTFTNYDLIRRNQCFYNKKRRALGEQSAK